MKRITFGILLLCASSLLAQTSYTAHEWGTFTSVQGGDGELLRWCPLKTPDLPGFVYNWTNPGLNRFSSGMFIGKGDMVTLQRMETPVIYFYSGESMNVDVSVGFPKGLITEWYPQASQIGPSMSADTNASSGSLNESRGIWKNLQIAAAPGGQSAFEDSLPQDKSGSHYFAARATGANFVRTPIIDQTNASEVEKFIFYRGAGSFKTPLHVRVHADNVLTVKNTGAEALGHLFLVSIHDGKGTFALMDELASSNSIPWLNLNSLSADSWKHFPLAAFQIEIGAQMESALVSEGLFVDEAKAMVNTWKDSWFTEEGERVLYILPRTWTDETLPMTLSPKPTELVRVMVGRAEIITPQAQNELSEELSKANTGDTEAKEKVQAMLKRFGRFALPAWELATRDKPEASRPGFGLLQSSLPQKPDGKPL